MERRAPFQSDAAIEVRYSRQLQDLVAARHLNAPDASGLMSLWKDPVLIANDNGNQRPLGLPGDVRSTTNEIPDKTVDMADEGTLIAKQIEDYLARRREFLRRYEKTPSPAPAVREQEHLVAQL